MASVELRNLVKRYGEIPVVDDVSLRIEHGLLVCLLGPSGCGKTTTLRSAPQEAANLAVDREEGGVGVGRTAQPGEALRRDPGGRRRLAPH